MAKASKLQNYKTLEAFVQCDYLDGYNYIDKAGAILNLLVREKKEVPRFQMGLEGLTIFEADDILQEIKISSNRIWLHFVEPKNIGDINTKAHNTISQLIKILKPTLYTRLGWRTYFIREDSSGTPIKKLKIADRLSNFDIQN